MFQFIEILIIEQLFMCERNQIEYNTFGNMRTNVLANDERVVHKYHRSIYSSKVNEQN